MDFVTELPEEPFENPSLGGGPGFGRPRHPRIARVMDQDLAAFGETSETVGGAYGRPCLDVSPAHWFAAIAAVRLNGLTFFDWLSGVDDGAGGVQVVVHVWSVAGRRGALVRTALPAGELRLPTIVPTFPGAAWHERETYEMFGVVFDGHPDLKKLLLPDEFEGHPLRKEFVLASRVAKAWPGAKEPGEGGSGAPSRRRIKPPGVPDDWGSA
jgi:NADH-quinone oxidoreductase subunit C